MVASTERIASQIGVDVMKRGGNAVDAAVAVAFMLAIVYPSAGNLGGGGFMMIRRSNGTTATAIDYRETAPAAATRDMYVEPDGELIKGEGSSILGYRASGVPGTVAGMALALKQYGSGKLTWSELIEPARKLAVNGFVASIASFPRSVQSTLSPLALWPYCLTHRALTIKSSASETYSSGALDSFGIEEGKHFLQYFLRAVS
jgi:gamma-glutamyltranspeptidase/glutathione hydrolase